MPTVDAGLLARLRRRYAPDAAPTACERCGSTLIARADPPVEGRLLWQCLACMQFCGAALGDADVLALLDAYEALVSERDRLRRLVGHLTDIARAGASSADR